MVLLNLLFDVCCQVLSKEEILSDLMPCQLFLFRANLYFLKKTLIFDSSVLKHQVWQQIEQQFYFSKNTETVTHFSICDFDAPLQPPGEMNSWGPYFSKCSISSILIEYVQKHIFSVQKLMFQIVMFMILLYLVWS